MATKNRNIDHLLTLNVLLSGLLALGFLSACGNNSSQTETKKEDAGEETKTANSKGSSDEDLPEDDDLMGSSKKQPAKPVLSVEPKKTGQQIEGYIVHQQNEFLGPTILKIAKPGIRLESSTITVIFPAGKEAIAYNPQNGNCMALTSKSAAMLAVARGGSVGEQRKDETKKLGTDKIAGVTCVHYELNREFVDKKTNKTLDHFSTEIWATKQLKLPPEIMKDCAKMTMMPPELGFPVRVIRDSNTTKAEAMRGDKGSRKRRDVISTSAFEPAKIDKGEFTPLSGFKTVTDEMKLMMADEDPTLELDDVETPGKKTAAADE